MRSPLAVVGAAKRLCGPFSGLIVTRYLCDSVTDSKQNAEASEDILGQICSVLSSAGVGSSPRKLRSPRQFNKSHLLTSNSSSSAPADARWILDVLQSGNDIGQVLDKLGFVPSDDVVSRVILGAGNLDKVVSFFDWACSRENYRPNLLAYNAYIQVLVKNGKVDDAMENFRHMRVESVTPNCFTYGILLEGLASADSVEEAFDIFQSVIAMGEDVIRTCCIFLIRGLCKAGNVSEAVSLYRKLRDRLRLEVGVYNSLICGMVDNRFLDQALDIRKQMDDDFCKPNKQTYNALVFGLSNADRPDEACRLLIEMSSKGYRPDPATCVMAIDGLCRTRQFDRACALVEVMDPPDIITYSALLDNLCDSGDMDIAFEFVDQIIQRANKPDTIFYSILIKGLCKANHVDDALSLLEKMSEKGCPPDTPAYNTIVQGLIDEKRLVEARYLFEEMIQKGCEPNAGTYVVIFEGFIKWTGDAPGLQVVQETKEERDILDIASYISRINRLCEREEMQEADEVFRELCQNMVKPPVAAFSAMVRGFLSGGDFIQADRIVQEMLTRGCVPDPHFEKSVVYGLYHLARADENRLPKAVFEMVSQQNWIPHRLFCGCLVEGFCIAGHLDIAYRFVREVHEKTRLQDDFMWEILIRRLCYYRRASQALEVLEKAVERGCEVHLTSYQDVIRVLIDAGMIKKAVEQFHTLLHLEKSPSWPLRMIHGNLMVKLCSEDVNLAYRCLQDVVRRGLSPTIKAYNRLIKSCCKEGMYDRARELFEQMQVVKSIPNNATYTILVDEYVKADMMDEAIGIFQGMVEHDLEPLYQTCNGLVRGLCNAWRVDEAYHVLQQLLKRGRKPPLVTFEAVFEAYCETRRFDKARQVFVDMNSVFRLTSTDPHDFHIKIEQLRNLWNAK